MEKKERNLTFDYLYAMAIVMVIDDHVSRRINFFNNIFPYNSFYMPLFVFVSGYFYKKTGLVDGVKHKLKKLLIPYIIWNIIMDFLALLIDCVFETKWFVMPTMKGFIAMFCPGYTLSSINGPAWFLNMLFWVSVIYILIRKFIEDNYINDIILLILFLVGGFCSIDLAINGYTQIEGIKGTGCVFLTKILFYIQFYHIGYMFRRYYENLIIKCRKLFVCGLCVLINVFLIIIYGEKINFYGTNSMASFTYIYLPLITSLTGIVFYYMFMSFIAEKIGKVKIVCFIARNTFVIMEVHLCFLNMPNMFVYHMVLNKNAYSDFDIGWFIHSAEYRYSDNTKLLGFICAVCGCLIIAYIIEKTKDRWNNCFKRKIG